MDLNPERCKVIACATVIEEMRPFIPVGMQHEVLDFGLHVDPKSLKTSLQIAIDSSSPEIETIFLGYGLCSQAVVGLKSATRNIIIPRVDDCISIFLGSSSAYQHQCHEEPGTYYLTRGWIESGTTPFSEYEDLVRRYGEPRARSIMNQMLKNYTRLAFIATGNQKLEYYRQHTRGLAAQFNLRFEEIQGSDSMIRKMLYGPRDQDFVVTPPGETISFLDFRKT